MAPSRAFLSALTTPMKSNRATATSTSTSRDIAFVEPCEPYEADFWTVYGHIPGEGVQAIGDFDTSEHAEEVFARITGRRYTGRVAQDGRRET